MDAGCTADLGGLGDGFLGLAERIDIAPAPGACPYPWDTPFQSHQRTTVAQGNAKQDQNNDSNLVKLVHLRAKKLNHKI